MNMDSMFIICVDTNEWKNCLRFFNEHRFVFGLDYFSKPSPSGDMIVSFCDRLPYERFVAFYETLSPQTI